LPPARCTRSTHTDSHRQNVRVCPCVSACPVDPVDDTGVANSKDMRLFVGFPPGQKTEFKLVAEFFLERIAPNSKTYPPT